MRKLPALFLAHVVLAMGLVSFAKDDPAGAAPPNTPQAGISDITIASRIMPVDVRGSGTNEEWIRFGWESFIALNWPSASNWPVPNDRAGEPDASILITNPAAASRPVVWQTYLVPGQVFLKKGANPGTWAKPEQAYTNLPDPARRGKYLPLLGGFGEKALSLDQNPDFGLMMFDLAVTPNPLIDQNGNYALVESRMNQSEFEYFKTTGYYDAKNQICDSDSLVLMPTTGGPKLPEWARQGAVEIKISWKILDPLKDIKSRYFTTTGYFRKPDSTPSPLHTFGLVGLHILRNTPKSKSTWFWTTFEQVDNVAIKEHPAPKRPDGKALIPSFNPGPAGDEPQYQFGFDLDGRFDAKLSNDPKARFNPITEPVTLSEGDRIPRRSDRPVNLSRVTPIPATVRAFNKKYQEKLKGTVWQYYEMIDVLYPTKDGIGQVKKPNNDPYDPPLFVNTPAMVNVTLEPYLAYKPSTWTLDNCLSCHYNAQPIVPERYFSDMSAPQVFSYMYRRAESSVAGDGGSSRAGGAEE